MESQPVVFIFPHCPHMAAGGQQRTPTQGPWLSVGQHSLLFPLLKWVFCNKPHPTRGITPVFSLGACVI